MAYKLSEGFEDGIYFGFSVGLEAVEQEKHDAPSLELVRVLDIIDEALVGVGLDVILQLAEKSTLAELDVVFD